MRQKGSIFLHEMFQEPLQTKIGKYCVLNKSLLEFILL